MKKKIVSLIALCMMQVAAHAQKEVTLTIGTPIPLQSVNTVKGSEVKKGQSVAFRVARDIVVDGMTVIPYGTPVTGTVTMKKKGKCWGYSGHIEVTITELIAPYGEHIPLNNGNIYAKGKGKGWLAAILAYPTLTIGSFLVRGTAGEIAAGYEVQASVAQVISVKASESARQESQQTTTFNRLQSVRQEQPVQHAVAQDFSVPPLPCAAVVTKTDGSVISAVIYEVGRDFVSYRKQSNPNGPMYKVDKSDVKNIKYQYQ